jgi:hypothetical protein
MPRKPPYATVIACLALFVALGGSAAAAVTLGRDSVGSAQIRKDAVGSPEISADAVRSPEIRKDAVRSPEISTDAVRSSEIRDESIVLADLAPGARTALETKLRFAETSASGVPPCPGSNLRECASILERRLAPGSWLIQAKLDAKMDQSPADSFANRCGLVLAGANGGVLDEIVLGELADGDRVPVALSGVATGVTGAPAVSVRCTLATGEGLNLEDVKLTALELGGVIGP